jgi:hypothetical protein
MRYPLTDTFDVLRTPIGRSQVLSGMYHRAWPIMSRLAISYRRHALAGTDVVAVVGSYGKTTTAKAVTHVLGRAIRTRCIATWAATIHRSRCGRCLVILRDRLCLDSALQGVQAVHEKHAA